VIGGGNKFAPTRVFNAGLSLLAVAILAISFSSYLPSTDLSMMIFGAGADWLALRTNLAAAGLAYLLAGAGQVAVSIMGNVMVQDATHNRYLGRVFGLMQMVRHAASFLAVALCGWGSDHIPVQTVILILAIITIASAAISLRFVRGGKRAGY
jgi:hypothetical protein